MSAEIIDYNSLIKHSTENQKLFAHDDKCDKYDYLIAAACGAVGGLMDIFLVGAPGDSVLGKWSNSQVDNAVKGFAKLTGWNPRPGKEDSIASAIGHLEKKFPVNYDQRHTADVGGSFSMSAKDHHFKSLAHSPDIIGLFFSIVNQFTSTASFVSNGQLITIDTETFELQGGNFVAKLFCAVANWIGHIMSDAAGSSGSRGGMGRGSGVAMPFYELFGFCNFGKFNIGQDKQTLAELADRAFKEGFDLRFGIAQAIPVVITELSIRLIWALRRRFQYGMEIKDCIPTSRHDSLRVMLLIGDGTLCVMDGADALLRSGGDALTFFMRLNLIAWCRFVTLVLKEVFIRIGIPKTMHSFVESFKRVNEALSEYLDELKKLDIAAYKLETEKYNRFMETFSEADTPEELNAVLLNMLDELGIKKPWTGDFDEFMSEPDSVLVFE